MAKVKPYIITVKYIATYADPAPTEEQILNELNIDALEVHIEEALVSKSPVTAPQPTSDMPLVECSVESRPVTPHAVPDVVAFTGTKKRRGIEYGFDTKHLELKGPTVAILHTLQTLGPKTLSEVREITNRYDTAMQVSMSRLKAQGRVKVVGSSGGKSLYTFVK